MRFTAPAGLCLLSLCLTGCNLDIDIIGQGRIYSSDQTIDCTQDCRYSSYNDIRYVTLQGEAAEGQRFLGMLSREISGTMVTTARVPYGLTFRQPAPWEWGSRRMISTQVTAIFHPQADIVAAAGTEQTICALTPTNSLRCWGSDIERYQALDNVSALFASRETLCAETNAQLQCWNTGYPDPWPLPDTLGSARQMVFVVGRLCVLHETVSGNQVHCFNRDGQEEPQVPPLYNPTTLSKVRDTVCAEDDTGTVCWGEELIPRS